MQTPPAVSFASHRWMGLILVLILSLQACDQTPDSNPGEPGRQRAFLSVIHAYGELTAIDIQFETFSETKTVAAQIPFLQTWPSSGYASLLTPPGTLPGDSNLIIRLLDYQTKQQVSPGRQISLVADGRKTVAIVESFGRPDVVQLRDNFETPPGGKANLRFMNLCHLYPTVRLVSSNDSIDLTPLTYLTVTQFEPVNNGRYTLYARHGQSGRKVDSLIVDLNPRKTYNVFLTQEGTVPRLRMTQLE